MIKIQKESEDLWMVYNTETGDVANIVRCQDYMLGEITQFYRVDYRGETEDSLIKNFQKAKSIAIKLVK